MLRVAQLRQGDSSDVGIERSYITEGYLHIIEEARRGNSIASKNLMRSTLTDLARLHGMIIERAQIDDARQFNVMKDVTLDGKKLVFNIGEPAETASNGVTHSQMKALGDLSNE